ncbi:MAG: RNB domain-containing ribonuclease [Verrucomicrobiota bacterium]
MESKAKSVVAPVSSTSPAGPGRAAKLVPVGHATDRTTLAAIAHQAMIDRGLEPDFPLAAQKELAAIGGPAQATGTVRDQRELLWASIDNDNSRDLDQLTVAEALAGGQVRILVAVADVDALVHKGSALDGHAACNTTSVYTPAVIFPMLPEALSTDLTSLSEDQDRIAIVADMVFKQDGSLAGSEIYRAQVRNRAKLAYNSVAAWLTGSGPVPQRISAVPGLDENLRLQDQVSQRLTGQRHLHGALSLDTLEAQATFAGDALSSLVVDQTNRATQLIEEFMVAANSVTAVYLAGKKFPSFRRVLRDPERWERIVELAGELKEQLPATPDAVALEGFLTRRRAAAPEKFADLSLSVIKLIGRGEYALDLPGGEAPGHFALAVKDYTHSTAPNRRFPDLITQRLLKAALANAPLPYTIPELTELAQHCTDQEDAATKVERQVNKSAAALLLSGKIGQQFDATVTGAADKGTWVRLLQLPTEGRLVQGTQGLKVGDHIRVKLVHTDVQRGFIDFGRA